LGPFGIYLLIVGIAILIGAVRGCAFSRQSPPELPVEEITIQERVLSSGNIHLVHRCERSWRQLKRRSESRLGFQFGPSGQVVAHLLSFSATASINPRRI
jgi:hypothetical protein